MWKDLRFALRTLGRKPSFVAVVVITLALGIGASTAIFSVVDAVLLRDLPYPDPGQLYMLRTVGEDGLPTWYVTPADLALIGAQEDHPTIEAAAIGYDTEIQLTGSDGMPSLVTRYGVTDQFFDVFRPRMELGRVFDREDRGGAVISYEAWRDLFGSDPDVIGRQTEAGPILGVLADGVEFPRGSTVWSMIRVAPDGSSGNLRGYEGYLRLRPDRSREQVQQDLDRVAEGQLALPSQRPLVFVAQPMLEYVVGDLGPTVAILFGATGILLLIACINVTNLLLSRNMVRAREMALRAAVGASRWRVVRQILTESLLVSATGGVLGLAVGAASVRILLRLAPGDLPRMESVSVDGRVLMFAVGCTLVVGLFVGLTPAWRLATSELTGLMNEAGRGRSPGPLYQRVFNVLVVAEVGLAVLLAIGAGLLVRSYQELSRTDPGFQPDGVLTLAMNVPGRVDYQRLTDEDGRPSFSASYEPMAGFFRDLIERLEGIGGVESVATTGSLPLNPVQYDPPTFFTLPDRGGDSQERAMSRPVSPGFFSTMRAQLLAGREFEPSDGRNSAGVAVVNESFARRFFPGEDPIGQRIRYPQNPWSVGGVGFQTAERTAGELEVVGVVGDIKFMSLELPAEPSIFMSSEQWIWRRLTLVVRTSLGDPSSLVPAIRAQIQELDSSITADFGVYAAMVRASTANRRLGMTLLAMFGLVALTLAGVGIYGLMSYSVAQRAEEMAVRSALGASARQVIGLVMRRGIALALAGVVLGTVLAVALRHLVASQLYGVSALDPGVFVAAPLLLLAVAALACFVPARRAARVDPADILRIE